MSYSRVTLTLVLCIAFITHSALGFSCCFDTDCSPGSKCVKSTGAIYGACMGGIFPGNSYDRRPVYRPLDLNKTYGNTCSFYLNCGVNAKCVR